MNTLAKILLVEDDVNLSELANIVLLKEGYTVRVASDGPSALELARTWAPDLVLLDVMMPGMDGYAVAAQLRAIKETAMTPIIIVSAKQTLQDKARGFEAGADDYITKPFEKAELLLRINAQLRRTRTLQQNQPDALSHLITVFSLRGGVGTTSLATNMASGLRLLWDQPVALLDLSLPIGACDVMLNVKPRYNLGTLAKQEYTQLELEELKDYMVRHESGIDLLGGVVNPTDAEFVTEKLATFLINHLMTAYRYIVMDTSHEFSGPNLTVLERADEIVVPIAPDISSVRTAAAALRIFDELKLDADKIHLVLNASFSASGLKAEQIEKALNMEISHVILHDDVWTESVNTGKPVILNGKSATNHVLENLVWDMSLESDRGKNPASPTPMWKRRAERVKNG